MDLDNALNAHAQWKLKFRKAIADKTQVDAARIGADNCCELGCWLHGDGRRTLGGKLEFTKLADQHKAFHVEAGKVAKTINLRQYEQAGRMLDSGSTFASASNSVGVAVMALKRSLAKAAA